MNRLSRRFVIVVLAIVLAASCFSVHRTLDEAVFYDGPYFKLRMQRRYDRQYAIVIDEVMKTFVIQCSSPGTMNGQKTKWVDIGSGGDASDVQTAQELIDRESARYRVVNDRTLVWTGNGVGVTFDGCATFAYWYPALLPSDAIDPAPKPDWCSQPRVDCRGFDFMGDRQPVYDELQVDGDGRVSFTVRSKAFKDGNARVVRSNDHGRTWTVTPIGGGT